MLRLIIGNYTEIVTRSIFPGSGESLVRIVVARTPLLVASCKKVAAIPQISLLPTVRRQTISDSLIRFLSDTFLPTLSRSLVVSKVLVMA